MSLKSLLKKIANFIIHVLLLIAITLSTIPFIKWYLALDKIPGSDFFNTASYLSKLIADVKFPASKWLYHWFTGKPLIFDYPHLHLYLMLPFTKIHGIIQAQNYYAILWLMLLGTFSYLLFWEISKDKLISLALTLASLYSASIYPSLITIGSVTFFATQAFFPATLLFLEKWRKGGNQKFFYLAALTTAISFYGHATLGLVFILPIALMTIYFSLHASRIKMVLKFFLLTILLGAPAAFHYFTPLISKILPISGPRGLFFFTEWAGKEVFWKNYLGVNIVLIVSATSVFLVNIAYPSLREKIKVKPYLFSLFYLILYNLLLFFEANPLAAVVNWPRSLWAIPLILGTIAASGVKVIKNSIFKKLPLYILLVFLLATSIYPFEKALSPIISRAGGGYVYPNLLAKNLSQPELNELKGTLVPSFLDIYSKQERLYSLDDRFNMWWSAFYDLPLVRGYFPGLTSFQKEYYLNQIDTSLFDNKLQEAGFSQERSENIARFYIDWYAIRYIANTGRFDLSDYLKKESIIKSSEIVNGVEFIELNDNLYSKILIPTNSPTLCFLGSENAYNYLIRALARFNLNSNLVIPLKGPGLLEAVNKKFLQGCDSIMIYDARTVPIPNPLSSRALRLVEEMVESGKPVFIETGEAGSLGSKGKLPDFFPISRTLQQPIEKWNFTTAKNALLDNVEVKSFSPPTWEGYPWKLSLSKSDSTRNWADVILKHDNNPVLVSGNFGKGKVVWSGLNLPFHVDYYDNEEEAKLFLNVLNVIIPKMEENSENSQFGIDWISPGKRTITAQKAKGVLFKESNYQGWKVSLKKGKKLTLYSSGPNHPGFMYARLPDDLRGQTIVFNYSGSFYSYFVYLISLGTLIYLFDGIIFSGNLISIRIQKIMKRLFSKKLRLFTKSWWGEE